MSLTLDGTSGMTAPQGAVYNGIANGTAVASTSGTSITFTGIPSWVKRITVMFNGVSTNGFSIVQVQIGTSSGLTTSGYGGSAAYIATTTPASSAVTTGFGVAAFNGLSDARNGMMIITNFSGNTWVSSSTVALSTSSAVGWGAGSITLSGALTKLSVTTVNGTDAFDAGSINIMYE